MSISQFTPITPVAVYNGLHENLSEENAKLSRIVCENKPSGNNYIDLVANTVRLYGKREATAYAKILEVNYRHFDGAMRCMTGMSAHRWINEYLRLIACDLVVHTNFNFKAIGKILGFSQSSFSQFFRLYQHMQAWEYRNLKKHGRKRGFFYD